MKKENGFIKFDWDGKRRRRSLVSNEDVTVSVLAKNKVSFIFRNNVEKGITDNGYMVFSIYKNRIFMKEANRSVGVKITYPKDSTSCYSRITCTPDKVDAYRQFIGDYQLLYDDFYELYYIERESE